MYFKNNVKIVFNEISRHTEELLSQPELPCQQLKARQKKKDIILMHIIIQSKQNLL